MGENVKGIYWFEVADLGCAEVILREEDGSISEGSKQAYENTINVVKDGLAKDFDVDPKLIKSITKEEYEQMEQ